MEPVPLNEQETKFASTLTSWFQVSPIYAPSNDKFSYQPSQIITVTLSSRHVREEKRQTRELVAGRVKTGK